MYLIYTPKGQGKVGRKKEIKANWAEDANMKSEKAKDPQPHPVLGCYHGFSGTGITVEEFKRLLTLSTLFDINRLHEIRS